MVRELSQAPVCFLFDCCIFYCEDCVIELLLLSENKDTTSKIISYMTTASKGASEKRKLTQYVINTVLDSQFRGNSQQFVLYLNEQFRRLNELTDLAERMPESIKIALLQNAVKDIPQLIIVETFDEYTFTTSGAGSSTQLTYTSYYNLLINACVRYDATNTSTPSKRRNVYTAAGAKDPNTVGSLASFHSWNWILVLGLEALDLKPCLSNLEPEILVSLFLGCLKTKKRT